MNKVLISITLFMLCLEIHSQTPDSCDIQNELIYKIEYSLLSILRDDIRPQGKNTAETLKFSIEAQRLAYTIIEKGTFSEYSIIIDKIIDIELKRRNNRNAEKIALDRLNILYSTWKNIDQYVNPSYLSILADIGLQDDSKSYYKFLELNGGAGGFCSTPSYERKVASLLLRAEKLYERYGKIYCLKYLQYSIILIDDEDSIAKFDWIKIYDLLIKSLNVKYSFEEIKFQYEKAEVKKRKDKDDNLTFIKDYEYQKSQFYFKFCGIKIIFRKMKCPATRRKYKECQLVKSELSQLKSELHKIVTKYAS